MNAKKINVVENKLNALHHDAKNDYKKIGVGVVKSIFRSIQPSDFKNAYLPISRTQGEDLRQMIVRNNCKCIVEFGTSFGISTIYLADGASQIGGKVITTELIESKAKTAISNIKEAKLDEYVEVKIGDAMETLKGHATPIDFLFLDGWKDLYLPFFKMLEPNFHQGTLIYADNMDMAGTQLYADYVLKNRKKYFSQTLHDGKGLLSKMI